jgi:hypothetical protein
VLPAQSHPAGGDEGASFSFSATLEQVGDGTACGELVLFLKHFEDALQ